MRELVARLPLDLKLEDAQVAGRIGSPLSPFRISHALRIMHPRDGVFWSPGFVPPSNCKIPSIVTVHDLAHMKFYSRLHALYYRLVLLPMYRKCTAIICVSDFTRTEFIRWSGLSADKVFTVHNGVSLTYFGSGISPAFNFPYVLYPGNRRAYKNLTRLLTAYAHSRLPKDGIFLIFTGDATDSLMTLAKELGVADRLRFAGAVDDQSLVGLYRHARGVAYVSMYEGFGLPILEGMAAGTPVLTSNVSSMPEIAGDAALIVNPYDEDEITSGLEFLVTDCSEREELISKGLARARQFDWAVSANKLWEIARMIS